MKKSKVIQLDIPIEFIKFKYCFGGVPMKIDYKTSSDIEVLDFLEDLLEDALEQGESTDGIMLNIEDIYFCNLFMEDAMEMIFPEDESGFEYMGFFATPNLATGETELHGIVQPIKDGATYIFTNNKQLRKILMTSKCDTFIFEGNTESVEDYFDILLPPIVSEPKHLDVTITNLNLRATKLIKGDLKIKPKKFEIKYTE